MNENVALAEPDGRSARWEEHRKAKREELCSATVRAIRLHGPQVGMDEIAEVAGTSKSVFYRHFNDRAGLWVAVVDRTVSFIYSRLPLDEEQRALAVEKEGQEPDAVVRSLVAQLARAYLFLVQRDPGLYEFVNTRPPNSRSVDPVVTATCRISQRLAAILTDQGYGDTAEVWADAIVGAVWSTADRWMATGQRRSIDQLVTSLDNLFRPALST